ncbi:MAG TPA: HAD-IC family P-type ATPase [Pilimelia sp.]|nr:HAD-IC family P-type ATPase [Pilimelia sp.]
MRRVGADRRVAAGGQGHGAGAGGYAAGGAVRLNADGHRGIRRQRLRRGDRDGARTRFGGIAAGLGGHPVETQFQVGLRRFSMLLVYVAAALTISIFVINVVLHRPILDALLFSLAIAVGITPQLLPAVVSMSLAAGSRQMARRKVLVKRLVCIEDLGDIDTLFTDKTGTLTQGRISFMRAVQVDDTPPDAPLRWGLTCTEAAVEDGHAVGGNPLDLALWDSPAAMRERAAVAGDVRVAVLPFDHERRLVPVLIRDRHGTQTIVTKGAPEAVLDRCTDVPPTASAALATEFAAGNRVVASPPARPSTSPSSLLPTSTTCGWPACWCSSTRPNPTRPPPWRAGAGGVAAVVRSV